MVCQTFLGDLIPKGEKFGSKQGEKVKMIILLRWSNFDSKGEKRKENEEKTKGMLDLGGGQVIIG